MSKKKTRIAVLIGTAVIVFFVGLWFLQHERAAHFRRFQGAWEGALHVHWGRLMVVQRIVLKVSEENGGYHAVVDSVDLGLKNLPVARFNFGSRVVNFQLTNGVSFQGALDGGTMEIRGRLKWPGGKYSQPLALTLTNAPDRVPEPLKEADYAPRQGSDLQGLWAGTVPDEKPARLQLEIAEAADGSFRAELNNPERSSATGWPVTSLNYEEPRVKIVVQGVAAMFEGELDGSHTQMTGTWTQGKAFLMTFDRVSPKNEGKPK
jgi:hypothetical protein